jgi:hypothetical protein
MALAPGSFSRSVSCRQGRPGVFSFDGASNFVSPADEVGSESPSARFWHLS